MMARSTTLQHKAGYIDARPPTASSSKSSCYARPDHTFGSNTSVELSGHVGFTPDSRRIAAGQRTADRRVKRTRFFAGDKRRYEKLIRREPKALGTQLFVWMSCCVRCNRI